MKKSIFFTFFYMLMAVSLFSQVSQLLETQSPEVEIIIEGVPQEYQRWNNCGPASLVMVMNYWGNPVSQQQAADFSKPDPQDKNVSILELGQTAEQFGLSAIIRQGGNRNLLAKLLSAGFPVILPIWYVREPGDEMGHYIVARGLVDQGETLIYNDSLHGADQRIGIDRLDVFWRVYNWKFLVVCPPSRSSELSEILGDFTDESYGNQQVIGKEENLPWTEQEMDEMYQTPGRSAFFHFFVLGTALTEAGNYREASLNFDSMRELITPPRIFWYNFAPMEAYFFNGELQKTLSIINRVMWGTNNIEEAYYWRARVNYSLGMVEEAIEDYRQALVYHADWEPALLGLSEITEE